MEDLYEQFMPFHKMLGVKSTVAYGVVYPKEEYWKFKTFMEPDSGAKSYLFCRIVAPSAILKPTGDYAIIYHKGPFEEIYQTYEILFSHLTTNGLELDGDIHEECLLHSIATKEEAIYVTKISVKMKC